MDTNIHRFQGRCATYRALHTHAPHMVASSTVGSRAFPVVGPKTWNALPEDVTSSQSEYTFCRQLKTWLFKKSLPDIIII